MKYIKLLFVFLFLGINTIYATSGDLKIDNVAVIDSRNIDISFNTELNEDSSVQIDILNNNDENEYIGVENYTISGAIISAFLDKDLQKSSKYSLNVLNIEGKNGETINNGIDGIIEFDTPENLKIYTEQSDKDENNLNSAGPETNTGVVENNSLDINTPKILGGEVIKDNNDSKTTEQVAKEKKKLPKTGPAETILFLVISFIAGALFLLLRRKNSLVK